LVHVCERSGKLHEAAGREITKKTSQKKPPLVPRYMQQTYHRIQERTWIKWPKLANILFQKGNI